MKNWWCYDRPDLRWGPAEPCHLRWSVGGVWPRSGTATPCPPAAGGQRSREARPCSTSGTAAPRRRPRMTTSPGLATGGSCGRRWTSQRLKLAQHMKRSHCPGRERREGRERNDYERDNKTWIFISCGGWLGLTRCHRGLISSSLKKDTCINILISAEQLKLSENLKHQGQTAVAPTFVISFTSPK